MTLAPFHLHEPALPLTLDLPFPPSTNQIWRRSAKTGMHLSKDYRDWKVQCDRHIMAQRAYPLGRKIIGPCEAHIWLNMSMARSGSDIDNRVKAVLDYLQRIELLDNDKLVMKLTVEWAKPSAAPIGCRVTLTELAG